MCREVTFRAIDARAIEMIARPDADKGGIDCPFVVAMLADQ